jgi:two-component system chemotaxis sensor kinase CheA
MLRGGLTTSGSVTELAGRGIGLDVVREVTERLGGEVSVRTAERSGTTLELRVPVSLASLEALVVEAAGMPVALPLEATRGALRVAAQAVAAAPDGDAIEHGGELLPLLRLAAFLGVRAGAGAPARNGEAFSAVIVAGSGGAQVALAVDRILGTETVMLRPLPPLAPARAQVYGAHIDAEGNPRLVLDPEVLVDPAHRPVADANAGAPMPQPILVVDDSLTTRMLEQNILESAGYRVELATSGEEGLDMARRNHYGLFLVDVEMPGMDGFTFIEQSRADPLLREIPCVLVTSRDSTEDRQRGTAVGASHYVIKSEFDQVAFLDRIARLVRRQRVPELDA